MFGFGRKKVALFTTLAFFLFLFYCFIGRKNDGDLKVIKSEPSNNTVDILPRDHLDAVRLELDGDLNMDYWREILFGVEHELVSPSNKDAALKVIRKIFNINDKNHDKFLDDEEIFSLIINNVKTHIKKAKEAHKVAFKILDPQHKGFILLDDFITKFLQMSNKSKSFIEQYLKRNDDKMLTEVEKDVIRNCEKRWIDADVDGDNALNSGEYLTFMHPELEQEHLERMGDKIMMHLDHNMDGQLSEEEFIDSRHSHHVEVVTPYPGFVLSEEDKETNIYDEVSRRREFKDQIDTDKDGSATRKELLEYINPQNLANTHKDVRDIIKMVDQDKDGRLSLMELMKNYQKVINTKMFNVALAFHKDDL